MSRTNNQERLQGLLQIMEIPLQRVADAVGMSRPYVSRIINGDASLGSAEFYLLLEKNLARIVDQRSRPFFEIEPVKQKQFEGGMKKLTAGSPVVLEIRRAS